MPLPPNAPHLAVIDNALTDSEVAAFFLRSTTDAVISVDLAGAIRSFNAGAEKTFGYSSQEVIGRLFSFLFASDGLEEDPGILDRKLKADERTAGWDTQQLHKNGSLVHTSIDIDPLLSSEGSRVGSCIVARESSRYKMLQRQLRQTQKLEAVGRLSGGIAHDFNNLLTVISGYNEMILREISADDPIAAMSTEIQKAAERATSLTNQLLSFSRREVTEPRVLNLNEMVEDLDKMLHRLIGEDVRIVLSLAPGLCNVKADPGQISQLVTNLVVNARDAMPCGGTVTIATASAEVGISDGVPQQELRQELTPGSYAKLTISDNGAGMDEETRQHLFEPFFTTKPRGKGTGLGLSIVYGIVSQLRGDIRVSSDLGKGTTFTILFPATTEAYTEARSSVGQEEPLGARDISILLVEDDSGVRQLVRKMLLKSGYSVFETGDPGEAVRICEASPINLLLTDIVLPGMTGRELARQLRKGNATLKILFMSGYIDDSILPPKFLDKDAHFIRKPFTAASLCQQIDCMFRFAAVETGASATSA